MSTDRETIPKSRKVSAGAALWGVTYDVYVTLRDDPRNGPTRMTYHDGVLEIMSPEFRHERASFRLGMLVCAYAASTGLDCEATASTTFRKGLPGQRKGTGKEPDESFYFTQLDRIRARETLDLNVDPPPDLWIEVNNRVSSAGKLSVYAGLGIPEVWRYRPRRRSLWMGQLNGEAYVEVAESRFLAGLTPALILQLLDEAPKRGQTAWDVWLRAFFTEGAPDFLRRREEHGPF